MSVFSKRLGLICATFLIFTSLMFLLYSNYDKDLITSLHRELAFVKVGHIDGTAPNTLNCYRTEEKSLPDISDISPRPGKSIFFLETSCRSFDRGKITVTSRQACAVESAAKLNPDLDVYLLFSSPGVFKFEGDESDRFLEQLLSYKNVKIMHLDYEKYTIGTPVEDLYSSGKIEGSKYAVSHSSDVLRFLTLWKYGGIYLDLDTLVLKSLKELPLNFAGIESDDFVGSAILSFAPDGIGHNISEDCLNDLKNGFNGQDWSNNGPGVITRVLKANCKVSRAIDMLGKPCNGITAYPTYSFFPIPYQNWQTYFREEDLELVKDATKHTYIIHIWNLLSTHQRLPLTSKAAYLYYAKQFCPKVVNSCNTFF